MVPEYQEGVLRVVVVVAYLLCNTRGLHLWQPSLIVYWLCRPNLVHMLEFEPCGRKAVSHCWVHCAHTPYIYFKVFLTISNSNVIMNVWLHFLSFFLSVCLSFFLSFFLDVSGIPGFYRLFPDSCRRWRQSGEKGPAIAEGLRIPSSLIDLDILPFKAQFSSS